MFRLCFGLVNAAVKKMTYLLKAGIALGYNYEEWGVVLPNHYCLC